MKKKAKKFTALALTLLLVSSTLIPVHAVQIENELLPLLNTVINVSSAATLSSTGRLAVTNTYTANDSQIDEVIVTTYVEKRSLLVIWTRVDLGTTNDEWVAYGTNGSFAKVHYLQLPSSGTYRTTATFDVYNEDGILLDSITKTATVDY